MISPAVRREIDRILANKYPNVTSPEVLGRLMASPGYVKVDEWSDSQVIASIEAAGVADGILSTAFEFWDDVNGEWINYPPTVPFGSIIGIRASVFNPTDYKEHMKVEVELYDPGDTCRYIRVYHPVEAHDIEYFEFDSNLPVFPPGNEEGDYVITRVTLYADIYGD